jgi:hypothetical protein
MFPPPVLEGQGAVPINPALCRGHQFGCIVDHDRLERLELKSSPAGTLQGTLDSWVGHLDVP